MRIPHPAFHTLFTQPISPDSMTSYDRSQLGTSNGSDLGVQTDGHTTRLTASHYAPSRWWLLMYMYTENHLVHHLISTKPCYRGRTPHLMDTGCTMQVGGAQRRSMLHNVVLCSLGGAQLRSPKPK